MSAFQPHALANAIRAADMPATQLTFDPFPAYGDFSYSQQTESVAHFNRWLAMVLRTEPLAKQKIRTGDDTTLRGKLFITAGTMLRSLSATQKRMDTSSALLPQFSANASYRLATALPGAPLSPEDMLVELKDMQVLALKLARPSSAPFDEQDPAVSLLVHTWCTMIRSTVLPNITAAIAREEACLEETERALAQGSEPDHPVMGEHTQAALKRIAASHIAQPYRR